VNRLAFAGALTFEAGDPECVVETDAHEGPVYVADEDALYYTTTRAGGAQIRRLDLGTRAISTVRADANMANGMTLAPDGRLVVCEQGTLTEPARISLVDRRTAETESLVEATDDGRPLNSPNDVVVASDGTVWFTDPTYGWLQGFRPESETGDRAYRLDPRSRELIVVAETFDKPNGLAFSPGERVLYVGDSGSIHAPDDYDASRPRRVMAFDVVNGRVENERLFADDVPGWPDGLKVDRSGRVYVSCETGVLVYAPDARLIGEIELPGAVNFAFGRDESVLYVTTDDAVWEARLRPAR
jgi:gluconolactonase